MYNPLAAFPISQGFSEKHQAIDFATPMGTPLRSPSNGVASYDYFADSGWRVVITRDDGSQTVMTHGKDHRNPRPHRVRERELLRMVSGNSGTSTGPHVHAFDIAPDGTRKPPFTTGTSTPIEETEMRLVKRAEGAPEWSLFHPSLAGASDLERGYYVITDPDEGRDLARLYADGSGTEQVEPREVYVAMQATARKGHEAYLRGLPAGVTVDAAVIVAEVLKALEQVPAAVVDELGERVRS